MRVTGTNFQPWPEFKLDVSGLTVILGQSNQGKSSLFRALRAALRNELAERQIRFGETTSTITVVLGEKTFEITRKKKSVSYVITSPEFEKPKEYAKLNGALPDELEQMKFGKIELGDIELDPIFAPQFGSQFLLQEGPQVVNTVLGAFSSTEKLEAGKREANQRIREGDTVAKSKAVEVRTAEARSAKLVVLAEQAKEIDAAIDSLMPEADRIAAQLEAIDTLWDHLERLRRIRGVLADLDVPDMAEVTALAEIARAAADAAYALDRSTKLTVLASQIDIDVPAGLANLAEIATAAEELADARRKHTGAKTAFTAINDMVEEWVGVVAVYNESKQIQSAIDDLSAVENSVTRQTAARLTKITVPLEAATAEAARLASEVDALNEFLFRSENHIRTVEYLAATDDQIEAEEQKLASLQAQIEALNPKDLIECPECGSKFDRTAAKKHQEVVHAA
jgi:DNA repair exonuclease SbcCD ATPase subunit